MSIFKTGLGLITNLEHKVMRWKGQDIITKLKGNTNPEPPILIDHQSEGTAERYGITCLSWNRHDGRFPC